MVAAGCSSLGLSLVDNHLTKLKENAESQERQHQFHSQIVRLNRATISLDKLQTGMKETIDRQVSIADSSSANVKLGKELNVQERTNLAMVLHRLFSEATRVSAEKVTISVRGGCADRMDFINRNNYYSATLLIDPSIGDRKWLRHISLHDDSGRFSIDSDSYVIAKFDRFWGDIGEFEDFQRWRSAKISVNLNLMAGRDQNGNEIINVLSDDETRTGLPCIVSVYLYVNGRRIAAGEGKLQSLSIDTPDFSGEVELHLNMDEIPKYEEFLKQKRAVSEPYIDPKYRISDSGLPKH